MRYQFGEGPPLLLLPTIVQFAVPFPRPLWQVALTSAALLWCCGAAALLQGLTLVFHKGLWIVLVDHNEQLLAVHCPLLLRIVDVRE